MKGLRFAQAAIGLVTLIILSVSLVVPGYQLPTQAHKQWVATAPNGDQNCPARNPGSDNDISVCTHSCAVLDASVLPTEPGPFPFAVSDYVSYCQSVRATEPSAHFRLALILDGVYYIAVISLGVGGIVLVQRRIRRQKQLATTVRR